jgi:hypothetical protein
VVAGDLRAAGLLPLVFVASDDDLIAAARAEGLPAENPLSYRHLDPPPP